MVVRTGKSTWSGALGLILAGISACRAPDRAISAMPTASVTPATSAPATVTPVKNGTVDESWVVASVPVEIGNSQRVVFQVGKDGGRMVVNGAFRTIVRGDDIEIAADALSSEISSAFALADRWYFVTVEGDIFRADSFMGSLVDIGASVGKSARYDGLARGPVLLVDDRATLWSFDGRQATRVATPSPVSSVWHTTDGAHLVKMCGQWNRLDRAGTFSPARPQDAAVGKGVGLDLVALSKLGARLTTAVGARGATSNGALRKLDTKKSLESSFEEHDGDYTWMKPNKRFSFSAHALSLGGFCDVGPFVVRPEFQRQSTIVGLLRSSLLVLQTCLSDGKPPTRHFELVDLLEEDTAHDQRVEPLAKFLPKGAKEVDATLSADETTLTVTIADAAGSLAIARGDTPANLSVHALPPEAKSVAFVDARRGMAIGLHLGQVWATTDGAASWYRLSAPLDGDPASVPLTDPVTCTLQACRSGDPIVNSKIMWVNAQALRATGFVQPRFILPAHVPADRAYEGLARRYPMSELPRDRDARLMGCPEVQPAPRAPESPGGLGDIGRLHRER